MRNITIGLATIITLLPTISLAVPNSNASNQVTIPCYNGGFNFGLAAYTQSLESARVNQQQPNSTSEEPIISA
jgi:hypothetical protein